MRVARIAPLPSQAEGYDWRAEAKRRALAMRETEPSLPIRMPSKSGRRTMASEVRQLVPSMPRYVQVGTYRMINLVELAQTTPRPDAYLRVALTLIGSVATGSRCRPLSIAALCEMTGLARSSVSVTLTALEKHGIIRRERLSRGVQITMSPEVAWIGTADNRAVAIDLWSKPQID